MTGSLKSPRAPLEHLIVYEDAGDTGALAGRILADLGARVIKRNRYEHETCDDGLALYREVFDAGKEILDPNATFPACDKVDVVICDTEPRTPFRPDVIQLSITPWGKDGPWADRAASDLILIAASGYLALTGSPIGPPVKPAVPLASARFASLHGVAALMLALRRRRLTGQGSKIDLSIRDAALWMLVNTYQFWDLAKFNPTRRGAAYAIGDMRLAMPLLFECQDGAVVWLPMAGRDARGAAALLQRMAQAGAIPPDQADRDWARFEIRSEGELYAFLEPFKRYFRTQNMHTLYDNAVVDGTLLAPVQNFRQVLEDEQLAARGIWGPPNDKRERLPVRPVSISGVRWRRDGTTQ
ncbi:Succinyl-CoA:(R)-benzylsuccinate CoA-transferase subunit BbsE [Falsiruegeria litorea R37]|uniref:Succinyl-CoA:(R)-benzylsuccinate CoA-transferase subunit BbsE n=1 Tax=Falsiruegeria litorea R37 TaxID=1200284 RepID=A0A1Y5TUL7_9RHOB|nr:CoA transferase [Falsiruegeria litorea]SLN72236.1 Succinyl-CoA:(R)-benzylsuccinate CoA-transferase subunit BbsE [Falsiruegeria litorea R37]